ncbi:MAG: methylenetetrahydrofolate reductase [NAD(P)H] [Ignavibacteriales bacterium]|nr:methylenetetrahydrofolate reductase [NAD(P)H] [Ignavibacteriales bacterium]
MHIAEVLKQPGPHISFEFFPPKTEEASKTLFESIKELTPLKPSYVSVTYGAGGSTRQLTHDLVVRLHKETDLTIVSHLTCVGSSKDEIKQILSKYFESGIQNIMALRGDPPKGQTGFQPHPDGFRNATELVAFIKTHFPEMGIGVAGFPEGHPDTPNRLKEIDHLKMKIDSGADYICTQLFFENRDFYDFCERCEIAGIKVPIIAGIMPVTSRKGLARMAELALGARAPAKLLRAISRAESDEYVEKVGAHWATQQVMDLLDHKVAGVHFYTLNRSKSTVKIYESLGVQSSEGLRKAATPLT